AAFLARDRGGSRRRTRDRPSSPGRCAGGVGAVAHAVLPGSGSAGLVWERAGAELPDAIVLPLPDEPSVPAMATSLGPRVQALPRPRVVVGSSLGALVALELARSVPVDALV